MSKWLTAKRRKWLYGVATAAVALAAAYGLIDGQEGDVWLFAVAAVLEVARERVTPDDDA